MPHSIKIKSISEAYSQSDNASFTEVEVEILKDGEVLGVRKYGFPLSHTKEDIEAEMVKLVQTLASDEQDKVKTEERAKAMENLESSKELIGKEIL